MFYERMYKIFTIILITVFLTGCGGILNITDFVIPDDLEFITCISQLNTVKKIVSYMANHFEYEYHALISIDPYELWVEERGDCNDMSAFAVFVASYNGIEAYQIKIMMGLFRGHAIAVYKEENLYSFSSNYSYYKPAYKSFREVVECLFEDIKWINYTVYDSNNTIIEEGSSGL